MFREKKKIKTVLLGDSGVGKTSIVQRYINKVYNNHIDTTIGAAFNRKNITEFLNKSNDDTAEYLLDIWDTAGQERYNSLLPMYYRGSHSIIMVYDICNLNSFNTIKIYFEKIDISDNVHIVLVGNKKDMEESREVKITDAIEFCNEKKITYIETSAKNNENIDEIFLDIFRKIDLNNLESKTNKLLDKKIISKESNCCN